MTFYLVFSPLIPLFIGLLKYKRLTTFFRIILFSLVASIFTDVFAHYWALKYENNLWVYFTYELGHSTLIALAWLQITEYIAVDKKFIKVALWLTLILVTISYINWSTSLLSSAFNILLTLLFGLQYYYAKLFREQITYSLYEPIFLVASAYILYGISVLVFYSAYEMIPRGAIDDLWLYKQFFYLLFNIFLAVGFYKFNKGIST